jgi:hypothetical protein
LNHTLIVNPMGRACPPNALRISRAAPVDRECGFADTAAKIGTISVAGTASGCMRWLGGTTPETRADLPDVMAREGATWYSVRMPSFPHADGRDDGRMRAP